MGCGKSNAVAPTSTQTPPSSSTAPASYTVTGAVLDTSRRPVVGAVVAITDSSPNANAGAMATTNTSGRYTLSGLSFVGFSLNASAPGFASASQPVTLTRDAATTTADFVLTSSPGISFDGLTGDGSALGTYSEGGFTVARTVGEWMVKTTYGRPAPFIQFVSPSGPGTSAEVEVTANGAPFKFASVDLYSSITPIPYELSGYRNGGLAIRVAGTQGNTFGAFATVLNPSSDTLVDTLFLRLSNPATPCCVNPMGLDNIRVTH
jgi:hypothetical protein